MSASRNQGRVPRRPLLVALVLTFALITYVAPYIRDAGLPDYAISLSLTVLGISGLVGIWITAAYPPGPRESIWKSPRPIEEREATRK